MGVFTEEQILSEHDYARPHVEAGYRLHGGFDANDSYISPRTLGRAEAVADWTEQLTGRGWPLIDADLGMFTSGIYPNTEQQALLVRAGLGPAGMGFDDDHRRVRGPRTHAGPG